MREHTLSNGLRVLLLPQPHLKSAYFGVWAASGCVFETGENNGVSHFLEHIVFKGSETRDAKEIATQMDRLGASVNAYTGKEYTHFYTRALGANIEAAAEVLLDMILHPRLDPNDTETERGVILEEISMCEDDPADVCYELAESSLFAGSPYAFEILGTRDTVRALQPAQLRAQKAACYTAKRMVIGVGGCFDEGAMLGLIERMCGALPPGEAAQYPPLSCKRGIFLKRAKFEQTHLTLAFPGIPLEHPDLYVLQVLLFLLGTGASSRLNQRLREQLGLVYQIDAWAARFLTGGYLAVAFSLTGDAQQKALTEICRIIRQLPESVTADEVAIAKEKLTAGLVMSREQPHSQLSSFGRQTLLFGRRLDDEALLSGIRAVTTAEVCAAAARYLQLREASLAAVGQVKSKAFYRAILQGETTNDETV